MKKKLSIFGMPVEARDYAPIDTITIIEKKGERLTVFNETTGSETVFEKPPKLRLIRRDKQDGGE